MQAEELAMETVITIDSAKLVLTGSFKGETETLEGDIVEIVSCEWSEYLKNGKTEYRIVVDKDGQSMKSIMILESENGNTTITFFEEDKDDSKLQFVIHEYTVTEIIKPATNKPEQKTKKQKRKS